MLTPDHWAARGLEAAARGDVGRSLWLLALVWSNGLFGYLIAAFDGEALYRRGYNRLATGGSLRRRYGGAWMDGLLTACLPFVAERTRLLIVKDFRTFRRDPQQWAQILIFTGAGDVLHHGRPADFRRRPRLVLPEPRQLVLPRRRRPA